MSTGYHGTHRRETHMQRYEIFKATDRKVVKTVPFFWLAKLLIRFIPRYRHMDFEIEGVGWLWPDIECNHERIIQQR